MIFTLFDPLVLLGPVVDLPQAVEEVLCVVQAEKLKTTAQEKRTLTRNTSVTTEYERPLTAVGEGLVNLVVGFDEDAVAVDRGEAELAGDGPVEIPDPGAGGHLEFLQMDEREGRQRRMGGFLWAAAGEASRRLLIPPACRWGRKLCGRSGCGSAGWRPAPRDVAAASWAPSCTEKWHTSPLSFRHVDTADDRRDTRMQTALTEDCDPQRSHN